MLLILILAVCLHRIQYLATRHNMKSHWNGYGSIAGVCDKSTEAPMVYRVLVPMLVGRNASAKKYEAVRFLLILAALVSVYAAWGRDVMIVTAGLLTVTFYFDYWDWCAEIIGLSLALVSLPLALAGVVIHGLSRETAPLAGLVYALHFRDPLGGAIVALLGVAVLLTVRAVQGEHKLYCKRVMWKENLAMLRGGQVITGQWSVYYSVLVSLLALAGAWGKLDGLVVPAIVGAGWAFAKANETRVFAAALPYAAAFLVGTL